VHWVAFGFGSGLLPIAPGTWGSALAVAVFWLVPPIPLAWYLGGMLLAFLFGVWVCDESARRLGLRDPSVVVFDEMVGMWLTLAVVPRHAGWIGVGFLVFRVMDIWKPWPIREVDHRTPGGLGIMLDDVLAAAYAAVIVLGVQEILAFVR
jgi:phosphatidylglycerophosphatase A